MTYRRVGKTGEMQAKRPACFFMRSTDDAAEKSSLNTTRIHAGQKRRVFTQKLILSVMLFVSLCLTSAFSDCDKRGFHGPTQGSRGKVFVYYRIDSNGIVTYILENRNNFPADVAFAVGDLRDGRFIQGGGCAEVKLNAQAVLYIYRVRNALR